MRNAFLVKWNASYWNLLQIILGFRTLRSVRLIWNFLKNSPCSSYRFAFSLLFPCFLYLCYTVAWEPEYDRELQKSLVSDFFKAVIKYYPEELNSLQEFSRVQEIENLEAHRKRRKLLYACWVSTYTVYYTYIFIVLFTIYCNTQIWVNSSNSCGGNNLFRLLVSLSPAKIVVSICQK